MAAAVSIVSRIAHESSQAPPPPRSARWWETLPLDFPDHEETFDLRRFDRWRVAVTAASDVVLRTVGATIAGSLAFPLGYHPGKVRDALRARALYEPIAESGDPHRFFRKPPRDVRVDVRTARAPLFSPKDGVCEDLRFTSPFVPFDTAQRGDYLRHRRNTVAHARAWRHADGPRPTVIALHGFSADLYHLNEWFFALPELYRLGCDVVLFTMPFHGRRQTRFSPFSGHGFFAGGAPRLVEAFAQTVLDVRVLVDWLERVRGATDVGVTGVSLGGYATALLATVEDRLRFVIPNVPVVSIADLVMEWEPIATALRVSLKVAHRTLADARALLAVGSPLTYRPVVARERRMIVGGVGDRLAPPKHACLLWEHWDRCRIHWFPGSHLVHLDRGEYLDQIARFVKDIGFAG